MNITAYVAGKITGLPRSDVKDKFHTLTDQLRAMGYHVVEPIGVTDNSQPWDDAVRDDIKKMLDCDEIHLLSDWQDSKGAQLERDIAIRLGMPVIYH